MTGNEEGIQSRRWQKIVLAAVGAVMLCAVIFAPWNMLKNFTVVGIIGVMLLVLILLLFFAAEFFLRLFLRGKKQK